jgi:hypothetical protein
MGNERDKGIIELNVFESFAKKCGIPIVPGSAQKREPSEPDILCVLESGEALAFELAEACAPEFAAATTTAIRKGVSPAVWGADVSADTIRKKLSKTYLVACDVQLLLYTNGRSVLPDDVIKAMVEPIFQDGIGQYSHVWLFGDEVHVVAQCGG